MSFSPVPKSSCRTLFLADSDMANKWLADPWLSVNPNPSMDWYKESVNRLICSVGTPLISPLLDCFWKRIPDLGSVSQKEGVCPLAGKPKAKNRQKSRVGLMDMGQTNNPPKRIKFYFLASALLAALTMFSALRPYFSRS